MCKEIREQFQTLYSLNVNEYVEKKQGLSYLSWANAWAEFKKIYPDAEYTIVKDDNGRCYFGDEQIGYMVYTTVTAGGLTYEMWLPVMDNANKSMKLEAYTYSTRQGEKTVEAISMFDVNKAVMRCLVKNLAMFGLGLYIYAGEDLPEDIKEYTCTDCGKAVDSDMAGRTNKKFGVVLCKECGLRRNKEAEEAYAAAQAKAAGQ
jgi:DNA-directed RNA polymerase subunit RPC12/RpoP